MSDVIVQFPVHAGKEAQLFGAYLAQFMERLAKEAELWVADDDPPFLMIRSDPMQDVEVKVLTFQRASAANDFSSGWAQARTKLAAG
ncbi:MAG TPA: hypothetical protein VIJ94_11685 [Caulobacteraceae bacterium]